MHLTSKIDFRNIQKALRVLANYFERQHLLLKDLTNLTSLFFASKSCFFSFFTFAL